VEAFEGDLAEVVLFGPAVGRGEAGEEALAGGDFGAAAVGDGEGVFDGAVQVAEEADHLIGGLHVELVAVEAEAALVAEGFAGLDAEEDVVGGVVGEVR
jgi:hypothetical protein